MKDKQSSEPLHLKYRPKKLSEVSGQDAAVKALKGVIERKGSHCYVFAGPSGVGKTTLARIAADMLGCGAQVMEIDAATYTGVDSMRQVQQIMNNLPLGGESRAVIIDECQRLSKSAWDSLLKVTEHPPSHSFFFFCTTEPGRIPNTIKTRSSYFTLKEVAEKDMEELLQFVCDEEKITLKEGVTDLLMRQSKGSPRQMLVFLELVRDLDRKAASQIMQAASESDATLELCRFLLKGGSWPKVMTVFEKLDDENPEGVRIIVCNYVAAALKNAKGDKDACFLLGVLENFAAPYNPSEGMAPLFISIGRTLYAPREE